MFELSEFSAFKQHLRDFLVQTKTFATQDFDEAAAAGLEVGSLPIGTAMFIQWHYRFLVEREVDGNKFPA